MIDYIGALTMNSLLVLTMLPLACFGASSWGYDSTGAGGPDTWAKDYPFCNGTHQSPININTLDTTCDIFEDIELVNFDASPMAMKLINNGHDLVVDLESEMKVTKGSLSGTFKTHSFHFHWGRNDMHGSEHTINGAYYPLVMHVVNYRDSYATESLAERQPDGLAVLAVWFEISDDNNAALDKILDFVHLVKNRGNTTDIDSFPVQELLPTSLGDYYRYMGSLTTPGCYESVTWTMFKTPMKVTSAQMTKFRSLLSSEAGEDDKYEYDNFRPTQHLNGRVVYESPCDASMTQFSLFSLALLTCLHLLA